MLLSLICDMERISIRLSTRCGCLAILVRPCHLDDRLWWRNEFSFYCCLGFKGDSTTTVVVRKYLETKYGIIQVACGQLFMLMGTDFLAEQRLGSKTLLSPTNLVLRQ